MADLTTPKPPTEKTEARRFVYAAVMSAIVMSLLTLLVIVLIQRGRLGEVDGPLLEAARARWQAAGIDSYELELSITGHQQDEYRIIVRDGEVSRFERNGQPLQRRHAFQAWGIEGMLETIGRDLDNRRRYRLGERGPQICNLYLQGRFHEKLGYPQEYIRMERGGQASNPAISWKVTSFSILSR